MPSRAEERQAIKAQKKAVLLELDETERKLLTKILHIERNNLHLKRPPIKNDLLQAVKETVK